MKRIEILNDFFEIMNYRFQCDRKWKVSTIHIGTHQIDGHLDVEFNCDCSFVESESFQWLCFNPEKNEFFYLGNSQVVNGNVMTFFILSVELINSLPMNLVEALRRVGRTGKPEWFNYPPNVLTTN